jgi:hypothetical protein
MNPQEEMAHPLPGSTPAHAGHLIRTTGGWVHVPHIDDPFSSRVALSGTHFNVSIYVEIIAQKICEVKKRLLCCSVSGSLPSICLPGFLEQILYRSCHSLSVLDDRHVISP